jgi:PhnB protein
MADKVNYIQEGYHTLTPYMTVRNAAKAIEYYKQAFGAEEVSRMESPDGQSVMHAEIKIGDSHVMMSDEFPEWGVQGPHAYGGTASGLLIYVPNVDEVFDRAVSLGATVKMPVADQFWGDRYGKLEDPFGHSWSIATHVKDLTEEEIRAAGQAAMAAMGGDGK